APSIKLVFDPATLPGRSPQYSIDQTSPRWNAPAHEIQRKVRAPAAQLLAALHPLGATPCRQHGARGFIREVGGMPEHVVTLVVTETVQPQQDALADLQRFRLEGELDVPL